MVERRAIEIGHVHSRPGRSVGISTIFWRDVQRLRRNPQVLIGRQTGIERDFSLLRTELAKALAKVTR